jgi:hypothetical protein
MTTLSIKNQAHPFNYVEVVLVKKKVSPYVYDIDFDENACSEILRNVSAVYPNAKILKKHTTKYFHELLEQLYCHSEKTFTLHILDLKDHQTIQLTHNNFLINYYNKQPLPNHSFPSTTNLTDILDSKRVSIKITNNIYINFDSLEYQSDKTTYHHIYINVNINKSSDLQFIEETINNILKNIDGVFSKLYL